ncbi:putative PurR-regulated permease PerM [Chitinophaga terrae (ex Kim and Jung 2007)]|uniref:conjugal transfer protein TraI n=1 Tax=Chitinophaga terrae (ex Kim and Jung 2007) TaxID=408074 RepID=UPI00278894F3|nr:conjugal transfer protein TraI [Chitinophaga terrae (ex Kim and Jung 2007)]MDQ0107466.1 putative PurR-regulated permease PerM [Chitinophaga terrae (ex Kim and Jung 2007)]
MKMCCLKGLMLMLCLLLFTVTPQVTQANPIVIIIKTAIKKVIRAMDLAIQRAQNETIKLQNIQKQIENQLSRLKLEQIAEWTEKTRKIYDDYFKELWKVKNLITTYKKVRDVIEKQSSVVNEYKRAWNLLKADHNFSSEEMQYIYKVYSGILDESIKNVSELNLVINSFLTQMSDAQRLSIISQVSERIYKNLADLRQFTNQNITLSFQRVKTQTDLLLLKRLYGLQ